MTSMSKNKAVLDMDHLKVFSRNEILRRLSLPEEKSKLFQECRNVLITKYNERFVIILDYNHLN